ncbi:AAA family ATPase [Halobacteriales archaeon Cl-PHB]
MSIYMVRGRKSPYQRNVSLTLANYLSGDLKADILDVCNQYPDFDWGELSDALQSETVTAWGSTNRYRGDFETIEPGDRILYWNSQDDTIEFIQEVSLLIGEEAPLDARTSIAHLLWRNEDYEYLWFSSVPARRSTLSKAEFEEYVAAEVPDFDLREDWFTHMARNFHEVPAEVVEALGGEDIVLEDLFGSRSEEIRSGRDSAFVVDTDSVREATAERVFAAYHSNYSMTNDVLETFLSENDLNLDPDERVKYLDIPRSSGGEITDAENLGVVLVHDEGEIVAKARIGNCVGKRVDGETRDLITLFDWRPLTPSPLSDIDDLDFDFNGLYAPISPSTYEEIAGPLYDLEGGDYDGERSFFILKSGADEYDDEPAEEYHFKENIPGTRQLQDAEGSGQFVYLEDGEFYAKGRIGNISDEDEDGTTHFYASIEDYSPFEDPVELNSVRESLSVQFPKQYGIIKITEADYHRIVDQEPTLDPTQIIDQLIADEARVDVYEGLYKKSLAHLVAGKNIVYYGPPGTGKTRAALRLSEQVCSDVDLVTANAEWTNYQVAGGYAPSDDGWESKPGFLARAAHACQRSLRDTSPKPSWLIIDELNRANLDEAFGDVFTLLDLDYRESQPIEYGDKSVTVPLAFRILATMNTYDQAQLFSLGYAFRRRFAFVDVSSLLSTANDARIESAPTGSQLGDRTLSDPAFATKSVILKAAADSLDEGAGGTATPATDTPVVFPGLTDESDPGTVLSTLRDRDSLQVGEFDFVDAMLLFAQQATDGDVIEVGQALLIDAVKFVIAYELLFPDDTDWTTVDQAVISYLVPQFEHFMPELRRAETIERDSDATERIQAVINTAAALGFEETVDTLERAVEDKRVLE